MATKRIRDLTTGTPAAGDFLAVDPASGSTYKVPLIGSGGVIEYGSNSNGSYVRFADGTQICWKAVQVSYTNSYGLSSLWSYPAAFTSSPNIVATLLYNTFGQRIAGRSDPYDVPMQGAQIISPGSTDTTLRLGITNGSAQSGDYATVHAVAIGRWK